MVYDRADKVLEIDRHSLMAIAGVPATAWEMARVLEHSFQFFRRTQLQEMSLDGKVRALSKLLRDNFGFVMQGVGIVVPIFATYDSGATTGAALFLRRDGRAISRRRITRRLVPVRRRCGAFCTTKIAGARKPLRKLGEDEAVTLALRALDTAAETDTATGGVDRHGRIFPVVKIISRDGIATLPESISRRFSRAPSHDRRAVSLGRGDRESARVHRAAARGGKPDRGAELSRWNFVS